MPANQNPEQAARDKVDQLLSASGWAVQDKKSIDFNAAPGVAIREYQTDIGPADYVLFVDKKAVGVIEAKKEEARQNLTTVEDQTAATPLLGGSQRHQTPANSGKLNQPTARKLNVTQTGAIGPIRGVQFSPMCGKKFPVTNH